MTPSPILSEMHVNVLSNYFSPVPLTLVGRSSNYRSFVSVLIYRSSEASNLGEMNRMRLNAID